MRDGLVSKEELEEILAQQQDARQQRLSGRRLGEILIQRGRVTPTQVAKLVAEQYELPFVELELSDIDRRAAAVLSEDDARRFWAVPISRRPDGSYLLAIADPATVLFSDELRKLLGSVPRFAVVGPDAIEKAIDFVHSQPLEFPPFVTLAPLGPDGGLEPDGGVVPPETEEPLTPEAFEAVSAHRSLAQTWPPLGALLVREGFLTDADLDAALAQQRLSPSNRLGEILIERGIVTPSVVARLVAEQYELPFVELDALDVEPAVARRLPEEIARRLSAVPVALHDGAVEVAISDPTTAVYSDELQQALDAPLEFFVAAPNAIEAVLDAVHAPEPEPAAADPEYLQQAEAIEHADVPEAPVSWRVVDESAPEGAADHVEEVPAELYVFGGLAEASGADFDAERAPFEVDDELSWEPTPEPETLVPVTEDQTDVPVDVPVVEDEPSWTGRLELVDEIASLDEPQHAVEGAVELVAVPAPVTEDVSEVVPPVEDVGQELSEAEHETESPFLTTVFPFPPETADMEARSPEATLPEQVEAEEPDVGTGLQAVELATEADDVEVELEAGTESELEAETEAEVEVGVVLEAGIGPDTEPETGVETGVEADTDFAISVDGVLAAGATTIHFSPLGDELVVRARVDGVVRELGTASHAQRDEAVERLEREGRVRIHVATTSRGEKTTLFVREPTGTPTTIEELGADAEATNVLRVAVQRSSGAILVCGPGRSGTTTTLYAALRACATPNRIVTTVEHPVERLVPGVDQIEVDLAAGATFASVLRELRFTDPDVVLVGELADPETTELALQAAYQGRLVLAAFSAPDGTAAALVHLVDTGLDPTLLASTAECIAAQRLVRSVCPDCRETYYASESELELLGQLDDGGPRLLARGRGCTSCDGSGFRGRAAFFEVLPLSDELRELVRSGASAKKIHRAAVSAGMRTLRDEAIRLCLEGVTTVDEVERVLGTD